MANPFGLSDAQWAREVAWDQKQKNKERVWAAQHPGIAQVNGILSTGGAGTFLDPNGDPAENAAFADAWGRMGQNRELSAVKAAGLDNPNDPYAAGFARTKARIASGSDMANAFANYKLAQAGRRSSALQQLLGLQYGADQNNIDYQRQRDAQHAANNAALAGFGGDLLSHFIPGYK